MHAGLQLRGATKFVAGEHNKPAAKGVNHDSSRTAAANLSPALVEVTQSVKLQSLPLKDQSNWEEVPLLPVVTEIFPNDYC